MPFVTLSQILETTLEESTKEYDLSPNQLDFSH